MAAANQGFEMLDKIIDVFIDPLVMLIFSLATMLFFWGLVVFISQTDNAEARQTGMRHMIWGLAGMLIIVTAYGIVTIITSTLGIDLPSR